MVEVIMKGATVNKQQLLALMLKKKGIRAGSNEQVPRRTSSEPVPLSFAQNRLWLLSQLEGGSSSYNLPFALRLEGELQLDALQKAFDALLQRHESLRTRFPLVNDEAVQSIESQMQVPLNLIDLSMEQGATDTALTQLQACAALPFDLANDSLVRLYIWRIDATSHLMLFNMHHIVSDGWSAAILINELEALYSAYVEGDEHSLPPLPLQYADFSQWQRQRLDSGILQKQLDYWCDQLAGAPPLLELPTDHPRCATQNFSGNTQFFRLNKRLSQQLKQLSARQGSTLFMTMQAAFVVLLSRFSRQTDICLGSPVANRTRKEIESIIGFFVNTLVLRIQLDYGKSFSDLMQQVRETMAAAHANQDAPFELVVDALQPRRDLSYSPLFQALFDLQYAPEPVSLQGLQATTIPLDFSSSKFDLSLVIEDAGEHLHGIIEYRSDLFEGETIERWWGHYQCLLESIVENPAQAIGTLPLVTHVEQKVLQVSSQNQRHFGSWQCLATLFERQVMHSPQAVAVVSTEGALCYQELNQRANRLAHFLRQQGVTPDTLVGIYLQRSVGMLVAMLAVLKAGGAYIPMDAGYPSDRIAYMLEDSQAAILISDQETSSRLSVYPMQTVFLDRDAKAIEFCAASNLLHESDPEHLAYVLYTSGSTGKPKGVMIPNRALVNHTQAISDAFELSAADRVLQFASMSFDVALEEIFPTLLCGATLVMRPESLFSSMHAFADFVERERLSVLNLPAPYWREWVQACQETVANVPDCVRLVATGSDLVSPEHWRAWGDLVGQRVTLFNAYGPTETTVTATLYKSDVTQNTALHSVPIGYPLANVEAYILDEQLQCVPIGVPGELYLSGLGLAHGYLNRPELTAERFIENPFKSHTDNARLYKAGDLARYLPNHAIEFLGRVDGQVKIRGFRIELGEVEALLNEHPQVKAVAVTVHDDALTGRQLVAYIEASVGESAQQVLRSFLKRKAPDYLVPACFMVMDKLPRLPNDKINRHLLPAPVFAADVDLSALPGTPTEQSIAAIWQETLGLAQLGVNDNFFEIGGHSLGAAKVVARLQKVFGCDLPLEWLFEEPTVAGMAASIDVLLRNGATSLADKTDLDWLQDAVLDPVIQIEQPYDATQPARHVLLTGATGFVGIHLLHELLTQTDATVHCLVRGLNEEHVRQRLFDALAKHCLLVSPQQQAKLVVFNGDLSKRYLGLSPSGFQALARTIDVIYHNGASINTLYPYSYLKAANVGGTEEVLRLACLSKTKPVHHVSTVSVFASPAYTTATHIAEDDPLEHYQGIYNGYIQSKWVAEKLVMAARDRGLPTAIYRLARVAGHSRSGVCNTEDLFSRLLKGCIQLGKVPDTDVLTDNLTPVDWLSSALLQLSQRQDSFGKAFHLNNPHDINMREVFDWVQAFGYPLQVVSLSVWQRAVSELDELSNNALQPMRSSFIGFAEEDVKPETPLNRDNVMQGLQHGELRLLPTNRAQVWAYLKYYVEGGYLPEPPLVLAAAS